MGMFDKIRTAIAGFRSDERASLSVETVIIFPLLAWVYLGMFVYFDSFRSQSMSDKAAYTIADMVSRETGYVTPAYINSLYQLHGLLTKDRNRTQFRLTIIRWNDNKDRYVKVWSQRRGGAYHLSNSALSSDAYRNRLPDGLPHNERLILLETWTVYEPPFQVGLPAVRFDTFTVTRPRFAAQVCWNSVNDGDASTAKC